MVAHGKVSTRPLNTRQDRFAMILAGGESQVNAWRIAYDGAKTTAKTAHERACRLAADPRVKARVADLQAKSAGATLLTVNDRLHKLASAMNFTPRTPGDRQALARLTDSYTKLAGGAQPEQSEVTIKGDPNAPVQVAVTVSRAPVRDRLAALRAAKLAHT